MSANKATAEELLPAIKAMANKHRLQILLLTQEQPMTVTELSNKIKLAYNKTADYTAILEQAGLVKKEKNGREVEVRCAVNITTGRIEFP